MRRRQCSIRFCCLAAFATWLMAGRVDSLADGAHPSVWIYPVYTHDLVYATDVDGVRINDFSECGYRRGQVELPNVTNVVESSRWVFLTPLGSGQDDGQSINAALNAVGGLSVNSNGFRGVVFLGPGIYTVRDTNTIRLTNSGVVLKGSGYSTMLYATSSPPFAMIQFQGSGDHVTDTNTQNWAWLIEPFVPAGTRTFRVDTAGGFQVGDDVAVHHFTSASWIHSIDMDLLGEGRHPWTPGDYDRDYDRVITRIEGNWITVDTPIPQTFDRKYSYGHMARYSGPDSVQNCGVEDLLCYTSRGTEDESNPNSAIRVLKAANVWVRRVTAVGYFSSAVSVGGFSKFVTVAQCTNRTDEASDFHFRYSFYLEKSDEPQYVLMRDCYSDHSRHSFVLGSVVPGPNAFVRCDAANSDDETGPHERWSTGTLLDNVRELGGQLISISGHEIGVENRGNNAGASYHGWTAGYTTVWNCYAEDGFRVRNPPGARNWLIGSDGEEKTSRHGCWYSALDFLPFVTDGPCWAVGADPDGTYDQSGEGARPVQLHSLYYAQLQQRLKWPGSQFREYRLGDIGWNPGGDTNIPVSPQWMAQVQQVAGATATVVHDFDSLGPNQWTAFTFQFPMAPNEQVVAASLSLGLSYPPGDHHLYVETVDVAHAFTDLGWVHSNDGAVRYTVPLAPGDLRDGQLNVALDANCGVDFAMLSFQVAPALATYSEVWYPFDTYVRDGSYADQNFFTNAELDVKMDNDAGFSRRAFLFWNLIEAGKAPLADAKVRLYCVGSGQSGNEQSASVVPEDSWSPFIVTWNTQPGREPPFAYWLPDGPGFFAEFTVKPQVAAALAGNRRFSLCIDSAADWGAGGNVSYASTKDPDSTHWPQLILSFANSAPVINGPPNQTMPANSTLGPLAVTVGDAETLASQLVLTATSSIPSVIANSDILLGGSGSNRTVTLHVPAGRSGTSVITLMVSDGSQTAFASFRVVVNCITFTHPLVIGLTNAATDEDVPLVMPFNIGSSCAAPDALIVRASSSNPQLFPPGSLQIFPLTGAFNRVLVMTPAPDRNGVATNSVSVSDGSLGTVVGFVVTVRPVEDPPRFVRITSPPAGSSLLPGVSVLLSAEAYDVETNLARIEFYSQPNQLLGTASDAPFSITWSNPPAGTSILSAVAYDSTGLAATSPPVQVSFSLPVVVQPRLYITQSSNLVVVAWLDDVSSDALQTTTNLFPPSWLPVTNPPQDGQGAWFYFTDPADPQRFYRLAK
jgi:hypothetical protein